jgi:uncharacterized protein (DUF1800 family)
MAASLQVGGGTRRGRTSVERALAPFEPSSSRPWDRRLAAHLLRRATFGARDELDAVVQIGVQRAVDLLLQPAQAQLQELGSQVLPHGEILDLSYDLTSQRAQWLYEMVNGSSPLRERMTLFWHDHFSVGSKTPDSVPLLLRHVNVLRRHALGSFRDLLLDVTRDPAMLHWLDNRVNGVGGKVNENYGREVLELYTMGAQAGYTQTDVYECARCLSGWTLDGLNACRFDPALHLTGNKVVLGKTIASAGEQELFDLVDNAILPWPRTAEYLVGKIWRYFVSPNPDPDVIAELATRFRASGFHIGQLMDSIFRSNAFYDDSVIGMLVKSPVEFVAAALRGTDTRITSYRELGKRVAAMGLPLLRYGNPAGLDEGIGWLNSTTVLARNNFADELTRMSTTYGVQNRFDPNAQVLTHNLTTAEQIVDRYLDMLVGGQVPAAVRYSLYDFMNYVDSGWEPFVVTQGKLTQKVRGLVHLILSLPEFQIN